MVEKKGITIIGLGPGDPNLLTRHAWEAIQACPELYIRTARHPVVPAISQSKHVVTFDHYYLEGNTFEAVYEKIVDQIIRLGTRPQGVVYAVPGHPFVAEATSPEIVRRAHTLGIPVEIIDGLSFFEPIFTALELDPFPQISLVDALELAARHMPSFPTHTPVIIAQIHSRSIASDVKLNLMSLYPDEHPVKLVHAAGTTQQKVESLALFEIDRSNLIGELTSLYVPGLGLYTSFESFTEIIAHLRSPEGCPWDREQTHQSLRPHLLEETYEVLAALDRDDAESIQEELGDLLLQIVLHAQIASEYGEFAIADVLKGIHQKILRRHPHVFGDIDIKDADGVVKNWELLKAAERTMNGEEGKSTLDGVALALPALAQAEQYQLRAARVGFDWPDVTGVMDKLLEEIAEVKEAPDWRSQFDEIGDLLFAIVNLARWYRVDAESALRQANERFRKRFYFIEEEAHAQGRSISDLTLSEMEKFWQEAKQKND